MKRYFAPVLIVMFILSSCAPVQPTLDSAMIYTQAAQTVQAQMAAEASLTPPTPTLTLTPTIEPTQTLTSTPVPSLTPSPTWAVNPAGKASVLILLYNVVGDNIEDDPFFQWDSSLYVGVKEFQQQMTALKENGYTTITVATLAKALRDGAPLPPRPVIITFDTNKLGVYKKAYPILKQLGFTASLYLTVNFLDGKNVMTTQQIKELVAAGWEIGSKGMSGINLVDAMSRGTLGDEISGSRIELEKRLGTTVTSFSYPGGDSGGSEIIGRVQGWGYADAVGVFKTSEHSLGTIYYLGRYEIRKGLPINDFLTIFPWKNDAPLSEGTMNMLTPQAPAGGTPAVSPQPAGTNQPAANSTVTP
jgi:peptidoglycan/xylan/chitin deacetylase (PgdA/CDA1 family)